MMEQSKDMLIIDLEDFVDYVYLLPDFEEHFEQLAAAALKAGE